VLAAEALAAIPVVTSATKAKRNVVRAVEHVAGVLGNTPAVCRKGYIHPHVIDVYLEGTLAAALAGPPVRPPSSPHALRAEEEAVVALLQSRLRQRQAAA
jgi:DNA topoisomerase-1